MTSDRTIHPARPGAPPTRDANLLQTALDCVDVVWAQDRDRRITYISAGIADLTVPSWRIVSVRTTVASPVAPAG